MDMDPLLSLIPVVTTAVTTIPYLISPDLVNIIPKFGITYSNSRTHCINVRRVRETASNVCLESVFTLFRRFKRPLSTFRVASHPFERMRQHRAFVQLRNYLSPGKLRS